ncbi:hypothetical protein [Muricoccus radiodurans]|uniref:hypothetical protein n=1 Tax=Muricoccus radiodurans TaxID=2231721 RepID=UPI003CEDD04C
MADLLAQGRVIHLLSVALCGGALAALLLATGGRATVGAGAVLLAGLAETWLALRVGFDARCFRRLAETADGPALASFDAALRRLSLMPEGKAGRPMAPRIAGARRLIALQGVTLLVQVAVALIAALIA